MHHKWLLALAALSGCALIGPRQAGLAKIDTIVVIYAENHSLDNM
jgi:phospholipase C